MPGQRGRRVRYVLSVRLEITRRADLAVRALVLLAASDVRLKAAEVAAALDTTAGFVPQVIGPLVRAGWVRSDPGPTGGYLTVVGLDRLSVLDVIEAVEGPTDQGRCVVSGGPCGGLAECALHDAWSKARAVLLDALASMPLSSITSAGTPVGLDDAEGSAASGD